MSFLFGNTPSRFFRAFSISGRPADLGFQCETCAAVIRYGLVSGQTVEHCGRREPVPDESEWHKLAARSLKRGMPELPQGFLMLDTWDESVGESDWDRDSARRSDDASAYEVPWV